MYLWIQNFSEVWYTFKMNNIVTDFCNDIFFRFNTSKFKSNKTHHVLFEMNYIFI